MQEIILDKLREVEQSHNIRILYACESGSRAWGFHSPDSDYDVRFIYAHDKDWYLGIEDRKDHIEFPVTDELDIVGYDVRKMLKLFRGSNAKIYEWLQSPVVYKKDDEFLHSIRLLMSDYYSFRTGVHHYLGLTKNTFNTELQLPQVRLKKYFYALRPVLAATWIVEKKAFPPMEFAHLREIITDKSINEKIEALLKQKVLVGEGFLIEPDVALNQFVAAQMDYCWHASANFEPKETNVAQLNELFKKTIGI